MTAQTLDLIGVATGAILTIMAFTYLLDIKPFRGIYRLSLHLFIGALLGYSLGIIIRDILAGILLRQMLSNQLATQLQAVVPLLLGIFLLAKAIPRKAFIGILSVAYLIGVGSAVALGGALVGTLIPQTEATAQALSSDGFNGVVVLLGVVCTLMVFTLIGKKRMGPPTPLGRVAQSARFVGRLFLFSAFGVAFAGAITASLSIFIGRIAYLIEAFEKLYVFLVGF